MQIATYLCPLSPARRSADAVRLLRESGFDWYDQSMGSTLDREDFRAYYRNVRSVADSVGIRAAVAHGPLPSMSPDPTQQAVIEARMIRGIEAASIVGAPAIVVHPCNYLTPYAEKREQALEISLAYFGRLLPYAKEFGVKLVTENLIEGGGPNGSCLPNTCGCAEDFHTIIDLDPAWITACLDIGHAACSGTDLPALIRGIGRERLFMLHVHDNDCRGDWHRLPFCGDIDFAAITHALGEIGFDGLLDFEAERPITSFPPELHGSLMRLEHDVGLYLAEQIRRSTPTPS